MLDLQSDQRFTPITQSSYTLNGVKILIDLYPLPDLSTDQLIQIYEQVGGIAVGGLLYTHTKSSLYLPDAIKCLSFGRFVADHPSVIDDVNNHLVSLSDQKLNDLTTRLPIVVDILSPDIKERIGEALARCGNILCVRLLDDINPEWAEYMFKRRPNRELLPFLYKTVDPNIIIKISTLDWELFRHTLRNIDDVMVQMSILMTAMSTNNERTDSIRCQAILERISTECEAPWNDYKYCVRHFDSVLGHPDQRKSLWVDQVPSTLGRASTLTIQPMSELGRAEGRQRTTSYL